MKTKSPNPSWKEADRHEGVAAVIWQAEGEHRNKAEVNSVDDNQWEQEQRMNRKPQEELMFKIKQEVTERGTKSKHKRWDTGRKQRENPKDDQTKDRDIDAPKH